jgi:surface antigen
MFDSDSSNGFPESFSPLTNSGLHLQPTDELSLQSLNKQLSSPPHILGEFSQEVIDTKSVVLSGNPSLITLFASPLGQESDSLKTNKSSVDELTGEVLSNSNHPILEQALQSAQNNLKGLAKDADFNAKMNLAFGHDWNAEVFGNLVQEFAKGNFSQLPAIEILPSAAINGANGAFASVTNTIYLAKEFVEQNTGNPGAITSVLLEEIGHYIDSKVNVVDAAGDEGDIFARVVQGQTISAGELLELKGEDDTAIVTIGGKDISIEKSQIAMTSIGDTVYQSHRGLDNKIYTRFSKGFTPDGEGVIWSDWTKTSSGTTYSAPSLETFNGKLYQSARGTEDKIYTRFSNSISPDGIEWSDWVAAEAPTKTKNAIALEVFKDNLYQSVRGFDNKIYTRSTSDGVTWSQWKESGGTTYSAPSLEAVGKNKLYQSVRGADDDKIYTRFSSNGNTWSQWTSTTSGTTYSTPDIEEFNGKLYQSVRGKDDKIYTRFSSNGINWSEWKESGGETPTAPTLEAVGDKLFQSVQGLNQKIYTRFSKSVASNGEITWSPWKESGGESPLDRDDFSVIPTGEFNAEYYNNKDLSGAPTVIYKESNIDKNWGAGGPGKSIGNDNFSVRWTGNFNFDQGNYVFKVKGDDGFRLWVDNKLVIDKWKDQTVTEESGNFTLSKGTHEVKVEYYEKTGTGQVKAWWEKGGGTSLLTQQGVQYFKDRPQFYTTGNIFAISGYGSSLVSNTGSTEGNCTWYAHGRVKELGGSPAALNSMSGNARDWDNQLSNGAKIVSTPQPGDIAQWESNHVAVVEAVNPNGTIIISESHYRTNWDGGGLGTLHYIRTISASDPTRYIRVPKA